MEERADNTVRIIVKLRDLDTDEKAIFEQDVEPPRSQAEEREKLVEAVARHKPEAEFRAFANHAASFLDGEHLVVAYFESPRRFAKVLRALDENEGQGELFGGDSQKAA